MIIVVKIVKKRQFAILGKKRMFYDKITFNGVFI